jgi:hypothetical protein
MCGVCPGVLRSLSGSEPEGQITVGYQKERVTHHPIVPPDHALDEVEQAAGILAGEQDGEP